jgi:chromate reductase
LVNKPEVFASAFAGVFDADGNLADAKLIRQVATRVQALANLIRKLQAR